MHCDLQCYFYPLTGLLQSIFRKGIFMFTFIQHRRHEPYTMTTKTGSEAKNSEIRLHKNNQRVLVNIRQNTFSSINKFVIAECHIGAQDHLNDSKYLSMNLDISPLSERFFKFFLLDAEWGLIFIMPTYKNAFKRLPMSILNLQIE